MSTLAAIALRLAAARTKFDLCEELARRDPAYAAAEKEHHAAYKDYRDAVKAIPDSEIRTEVDAAIKALLEISAGTSS